MHKNNSACEVDLLHERINWTILQLPWQAGEGTDNGLFDPTPTQWRAPAANGQHPDGNRLAHTHLMTARGEGSPVAVPGSGSKRRPW